MGEYAADPRDATASNSTDPMLGYLQIAIHLDEWQHENP